MNQMINIIKGVLILIMIFSHSIFYYLGIYQYNVYTHVIIGLFFILSGYLTKPINNFKDYFVFLKKKLSKVLPIYFICIIFLYLLKGVITYNSFFWFMPTIILVWIMSFILIYNLPIISSFFIVNIIYLIMQYIGIIKVIIPYTEHLHYLGFYFTPFLLFYIGYRMNGKIYIIYNENKQTILSFIGKNSLYFYMFHYFLYLN